MNNAEPRHAYINSENSSHVSFQSSLAEKQEKRANRLGVHGWNSKRYSLAIKIFTVQSSPLSDAMVTHKRKCVNNPTEKELGTFFFPQAFVETKYFCVCSVARAGEMKEEGKHRGRMPSYRKSLAW